MLVDLESNDLSNVRTSYNHRALYTLRDRIKKITTSQGKYFLQIGDRAALKVPDLYVSIKDIYPVDVYSNQFYDNAFSPKLTVFLQHIAGISNQQIANILITTNTSNTKHPRLPGNDRREFARDLPSQGETFFDVNDLGGDEEIEPERKRHKPVESRITIHDGVEDEGVEFYVDEENYIQPEGISQADKRVMIDYHGVKSTIPPSETRESEVDPTSMDPYDVKIRLFDIPTYTHFAVKIEGLHDSKYLQPNIVAALEKSVSMLNARAGSHLHGSLFSRPEYKDEMFNIGDILTEGLNKITSELDEHVRTEFDNLKQIIRFFLLRYVVRLTNIRNEPAFNPVTFWLYDFEHRDLLIVAVNIVGLENKLMNADKDKLLEGFLKHEQEVILSLSYILAFVLQKGTEYYIERYRQRCADLEHPVFKDPTITQRFADLVGVQFSIAKTSNPSGSYIPVGELERLQRQQSYILNYFSSL